jgi:hypothetical protein
MTQAHQDNCRRHAFRRAWERYGLVIGRVELRRIEARIAAGRARLIRRDPDGRGVDRLTWRERAIYPVYDPGLARVVTFLPSGWAEREPLSA